MSADSHVRAAAFLSRYPRGNDSPRPNLSLATAATRECSPCEWRVWASVKLLLSRHVASLAINQGNSIPQPCQLRSADIRLSRLCHQNLGRHSPVLSSSSVEPE